MIMESKIRKVPRFGDVIEIRTPTGLAYAQYTHKYDAPPKWGHLIRVLPGLFEARPADFAALVIGKERFWVFFPLGAMLRRETVSMAGHEEVPENARKFPLFRAPGGIDRSGRIHDWWLWNGERSWKIGQLKRDQMRLPIREIWNDKLLIERIAAGWTPETDPRTIESMQP